MFQPVTVCDICDQLMQSRQRTKHCETFPDCSLARNVKNYHVKFVNITETKVSNSKQMICTHSLLPQCWTTLHKFPEKLTNDRIRNSTENLNSYGGWNAGEDLTSHAAASKHRLHRVIPRISRGPFMIT